MAFESRGPISLALPAFRGITRKLILTALVAFFALAVLRLVNAKLAVLLVGATIFVPANVTYGLVWALVTYPFVGGGLLSTIFALLSVWFFGSSLEDDRGSRWLLEYFLTATIGGALLALLLGYAVDYRIAGIGAHESAAGLWPFVLSLILAFARFYPNQTVRFYFIFQIRAKNMAAIVLLIYLALVLIAGDRFNAALALSNALAGYVFLRVVPRNGLQTGASEWWFGLRNAWLRAKRRRAAKKFTVYMKKQGRDVSLDENGRYIDPSGTPRDPNDRRWMN